MKICVFGAASEHIDKKYIDAVEVLCEKLAKKGHSLVFGAGNSGLMGAAARGFKAGGGYIHGIIPKFFQEMEVEVIYDDCDELTLTETMAERKSLMEDNADAFLIVPGGIGTLEETFQVMTLKQLGRHNKCIAIYNVDGFYDQMEGFLKNLVDKKFITCACSEIYQILHCQNDVVDYVTNYVPMETPWQKLKKGE